MVISNKDTESVHNIVVNLDITTTESDICNNIPLADDSTGKTLKVWSDEGNEINF